MPLGVQGAAARRGPVCVTGIRSLLVSTAPIFHGISFVVVLHNVVDGVELGAVQTEVGLMLKSFGVLGASLRTRSSCWR